MTAAKKKKRELKDSPLSQEDTRELEAFEPATADDPTFPAGKLEAYWFAKEHVDLWDNFAFTATQATWMLKVDGAALEGKGSEKIPDYGFGPVDDDGAPRRRKEKFSFEGERDDRGFFQGWKSYEDRRMRMVGRRVETTLAGRMFDPQAPAPHAFFLLRPGSDVEEFESCLAWLVTLLLECTKEKTLSVAMRAAHKELVPRIGEGDAPLPYEKRWPGARNPVDQEHWASLLEIDTFLRGRAEDPQYSRWGRRMGWALLPVVRAHLHVPDDARDERIAALEAEVAAAKRVARTQP